MRLLHTSDWHLGASDSNLSYKDDQLCFIDEICDLIDEKNIDAVIIAGDVYDRSQASAEAVAVYDYAMTRICMEKRALVLEIAGNHDSAERLASCSELLSGAGLYVSGSLSRKPVIVEREDTQIFLLPWITEEKVRSVYSDKKDMIHSLDDAYRVVTDDLKTYFDPDKKHILTAHAFVTNSETSTSDRAAEIGFAAQISASVFDGFDYVALGHIHKPQNVNAFVRYSGTPMAYSFGKEETQEKGVTIIDTETLEKEIVPLHPYRRRTTLTGTLAELLDPDVDEDVKKGFVKLVVTDAYIGPETMSRFYELYENLLEVSGKTYESSESENRLTLEELEQIESDPVAVFKEFCKEEMDLDADDHLIGLFKNAVEEVSAKEAEA